MQPLFFNILESYSFTNKKADKKARRSKTDCTDSQLVEITKPNLRSAGIGGCRGFDPRVGQTFVWAANACPKCLGVFVRVIWMFEKHRDATIKFLSVEIV